MDLQAEYDNRARVPEHPAIFGAWQRDAAAWRAACPKAELDLAYGETERQKLDLFSPGPDQAPLAMFIHGGYWQALDRSFASHCARGLNAHGVAVAVPSYDLCPTVPLATIVAQMRAAAVFLWRRRGQRLLAMGHSAGGHLAVMLLATDWQAMAPDLPADLVKAALPISGVFDLAPLLSTTIGAGLGLDAEAARALSPRFLAAPARPLHCVVGGAESLEFLRQSQALAEAWGGAYEAQAGANHFTVIAPLAEPQSGLVRRALALL